jgi:hypothetical protein
MVRTIHFFATYYQQKDSALTLVQSLLRQTKDNWKLTICSNGDESIHEFESQYGFIWKGDPRITIKKSEVNTQFWGALNRRDFIQSDELLPNEMLVNTSVEDYYVPQTVEFVSYKLYGKLPNGSDVYHPRTEQFVMWDFTHHHFGYNLASCISQPRLKKIDWGNYAILGEIAKNVKITPLPLGKRDENYNDILENPWESFYGDGLFVEEVFKQFPNITNVRLPKVLFAKN